MQKPIKVSRDEIQKRYKPIEASAHKGTQGHALLIGGSCGKMGSISLSTKAALRAGCGLVTAFIPKCGYEILQIAIPEGMVLTDINEKHLSKIEFALKPQAIGIGPGLDQENVTQKAVHEFLKNNEVPLVADADALNILAANKKWLPLLPPKTILTPHQKELERLIGKWKSEGEKIQMAIDFGHKYNLILVLKGAPTVIIDGDTIYENTSGNQSLATAGTGDVLTGIITGLRARSFEAVDAALIGVYVHGLTADLALPLTGHESFIASDIISHLGKAFLSLQK